MPANKTTVLRLYCICGQKMKVSDDMYGRRGKCVACRQKIRIPRRDEVPPRVDELYLRDHPEFLRKSTRKPIKLPKVRPPDDDTPALGGDDDGRHGTSIPLDALEPLRALCSLEHKVTRTLRKLDEVSSGADEKNATNRAELEGYLARISHARDELDDVLRQRLMEVAIELASTHEKIAEARLAVRVGEIDYSEFRETILKLRNRRDRLERRQINLRGWLATHDPYVAGGYADLPMSAIPPSGYRYILPQDSESTFLPLETYLDELRDAYDQRERAERKLAEADGLEQSGTKPGSLVEVRAESRAAARHASALIDYLRGRLDEMNEDYERDAQAIQAQIDLARGRLQVGEIDRPRFDRIESDLGRLRTDMAKARAVVQRAIGARRGRDVPYASGTFLQRLARARRADGITADMWVAGGAGLAFAATLVLPVLDNYSPFDAIRQLPTPGVQWLFAGPMAAACLTALTLLVPLRSLRGWLFMGWWSLFALAATFYTHRLSTSTSVLGTLWRESSSLEAGGAAFMAGLVALILASALALWPLRAMRWPFLGASMAVLMVVAAVSTNYFGMLRAEPRIAIYPSAIPNDPFGRYEAAVSLQNAGGLPLIIDPERLSGEAMDFFIERQVGADSWMPLESPHSVQIGSARQPGVPPRITVGAKQSITYFYTLEPGEYRARITGPRLAAPVVEAFSLEPRLSLPVTPIVPSDDIDEPEFTSIPEDYIPGVTAELRGLVMADAFPQFSIRLAFPDGSMVSRKLSLQDELYNRWQIAEFDPNEQTLTLGKDGSILILRKGVPVRLEMPGN